MASPIMADFVDHTYIKKKIFFQLNIKRSQPFHMDFMICLHEVRKSKNT